MKLASPVQRICAFLLDAIILIFIMFLIESIFYGPDTRDMYIEIIEIIISGALRFNNTLWFLGRFAEGKLAIIRLVQLLSAIGYFIVLPIVWSKQTLGRLIFKIKLIKINGSHLSPGTLMIREVMGKWLISLFTLGVTILISLIMMFVAPGRRTIHDRMSNTLMVTTNG